MADFWQWQGDPGNGAGYMQSKGRLNANQETVYSSTATFSSGSTATSSNTFAVGALTADNTTVAHEVFITNDGPYDVTADIFKVISAGATVNADIGVAFLVPATKASAGVTVGGKGVQVQGLFNVDLGLIIRLTLTAALTALVTNNVLIKELDL
jgi:hypothetical protein